MYKVYEDPEGKEVLEQTFTHHSSATFRRGNSGIFSNEIEEGYKKRIESLNEEMKGLNEEIKSLNEEVKVQKNELERV